MKEKYLDTALTQALTLVLELREERRRWTLEMDFRLDQVMAREAELMRLIKELGDELIKIQAQNRIDAQLLNLIQPDAGERKCPKGESESSSSRTHTLKGFARKTH